MLTLLGCFLTDNMNLYEIMFSHSGSKDTKEGIVTYLLAKDEAEV